MKILSNEEIARRIDVPMLRILSQTADAMGVEAYIVGGYVRDMLLERPSKDIDVLPTFRFSLAHTASFLSHDARIAPSKTDTLLSETNRQFDKANL